MKIYKHITVLLCYAITLVFISGCASVPEKKFFILNYIPSTYTSRYGQGPYPVTLRVKEFDIEEAYSRPQIVYRKSPFELRYYYYRLWAVRPKTMITDLVFKHLANSRLVSHVVRRYDEDFPPEYELSGRIEALEEYDSEGVWFAHLALNLSLIRLSDSRLLYSRRFDHRKRVFQNDPEFIIREMSAILEYIMNQAIIDMDRIFAAESGHIADLKKYPPSARENQPSDAYGEIK